MVNYLDKLNLDISELWFSNIKNNQQKFNIELIKCDCVCHNNEDRYNLDCQCNCSRIKSNLIILSRKNYI